MTLRRVFSNSAAQIIAKILTIIIGVATVKLLTSSFGAEGYGLYAKVHNYAAIFAAIADLGLFTITVRDIAAHRDDRDYVRKLISHVTGLRFSLGVILGFVAILLAFVLPGYHDMTTICAVFITQIFVIFGLIYSSYLSYLQAGLRTEFSLVSSLVGRVLTFGLMAYVALILTHVQLDVRLILVFLSALLGNVVMTVMLGWYTCRFEKIKMMFSMSYFCDLVRKNSWYICAIFFSTIFLRIDVLMISLLEPTSVADRQVGYYSVAIKLVEVALYFGTIVLNSFLPLFVQGKGKKEKGKSEQVKVPLEREQKCQDEEKERGCVSGRKPLSPSLRARANFIGSMALSGGQTALFTLLLGGLIFGSVCSFFAPQVVTLISNHSFVGPVSGVLMIVCWSVVFHYVGLFFSYLMIAHEHYRALFYLNGVVFLINIVLNVILIAEYSIVGAAVASVVSQFCFSLFSFVIFLVKVKR